VVPSPSLRKKRRKKVFHTISILLINSRFVVFAGELEDGRGNEEAKEEMGNGEKAKDIEEKGLPKSGSTSGEG
jgi:hypothetical protein